MVACVFRSILITHSDSAEYAPIAPLGKVSDAFAAKAIVALLYALRLALLLYQGLYFLEQLAGLRGEFIQGATQDLVGQAVGGFYVRQRDFGLALYFY